MPGRDGWGDVDGVDELDDEEEEEESDDDEDEEEDEEEDELDEVDDEEDELEEVDDVEVLWGLVSMLCLSAAICFWFLHVVFGEVMLGENSVRGQCTYGLVGE